MGMRWSRFLFLALLCAAVAAAASEDSPLLRTHWICGALSRLRQAGALPGKESAGEMTREQAAEAVQRLVWDGSNSAGAGAPGRPAKEYREHAATLAKLAQELEPELERQGVPAADLQAAVERIRALWTDGHPQGVLEPLAPSLDRRDPKAREEGARRAVGEWERDEVVLEVAGPVPDAGRDLPNALPLRSVEAADNAACEGIAGHNAEVWRRLREAGPPRGSRLAWLRLVFRPSEAWKEAGKREMRLTFERPEAAAPDGSARVRLESRNGETLVRVLQPREVAVRIPTVCSCRRVVEVAWGPEGSGVLFIQSRVNYAEEKAFRRYVVELRTGAILNAEAARG